VSDTRESETSADTVENAAAHSGGEEGGEALGFTQAMEELEGILRRIEGEETDIDALATELQRAARLIELCRGKIRKAELEVTQIVQQLEPEESGEEG
jgi:exodeoxyribonuclease VII small subunit